MMWLGKCGMMVRYPLKMSCRAWWIRGEHNYKVSRAAQDWLICLYVKLDGGVGKRRASCALSQFEANSAFISLTAVMLLGS
jgi:hypothetical protein